MTGNQVRSQIEPLLCNKPLDSQTNLWNVLQDPADWEVLSVVTTKISKAYINQRVAQLINYANDEAAFHARADRLTQSSTLYTDEIYVS